MLSLRPLPCSGCTAAGQLPLRTNAQDFCFIPLGNAFGTNPGLGPPPRHDRRGFLQVLEKLRANELSVRSPQRNTAREKGRAALEQRPSELLLLFFPSFFPATLARQCLFDALFLAGFQVKGVTLYLLDNVFLLHFALKTAQSVFEGFSLLQSDFRQLITPPDSSYLDPDSYCKVLSTSQAVCVTVGPHSGQGWLPIGRRRAQKDSFNASCSCLGGYELRARTGLEATW